MAAAATSTSVRSTKVCSMCAERPVVEIEFQATKSQADCLARGLAS